MCIYTESGLLLGANFLHQLSVLIARFARVKPNRGMVRPMLVPEGLDSSQDGRQLHEV